MTRKYVYSLSHCKEEGEDYEQRKILGFFTSKEKAKKALERFRQLPGFRQDTKEELFIFRDKLGLSFWDDGYISLKELAASDGTIVVGDYDGIEERIIDAPYWSKKELSHQGESGEEFAERLMNKRYQVDDYPSGPESEFYQIKKLQDLKNENTS